MQDVSRPRFSHELEPVDDSPASFVPSVAPKATDALIVRSRDRVGVEDATNLATVRAAAIAAAKKHRTAQDAAPEKIAESWLRDRRLDLLADGRVIGMLFCPVHASLDRLANILGTSPGGAFPMWLDAEPRWFSLDEFAKLSLGIDGPEAEMTRRRNIVDSEMRKRGRELEDQNRLDAIAMERKRTLEARADQWRNLPPQCRALLRNAGDPQHGELFATLALILSSEPHNMQANEQPPRCAWDALRIQPMSHEVK